MPPLVLGHSAGRRIGLWDDFVLRPPNRPPADARAEASEHSCKTPRGRLLAGCTWRCLHTGIESLGWPGGCYMASAATAATGSAVCARCLCVMAVATMPAAAAAGVNPARWPLHSRSWSLACLRFVRTRSVRRAQPLAFTRVIPDDPQRGRRSLDATDTKTGPGTLPGSYGAGFRRLAGQPMCSAAGRKPL